MTYKSKDEDIYMQNLTPERKEALGKVNALIPQTVPGITETMRYRMPTFELNEVVCSSASQEYYISLYMDTEIVEKYRYILANKMSEKVASVFSIKIDDLPMDTISNILKETIQKQSGK